MPTSALTDFHIRDAATALRAASLPVLDKTSTGDGVRVCRARHFADRVRVVPVINGNERLPRAIHQLNDVRAEWVRLMAAARKALNAAGWESRGETELGGEFLAHTPAVRRARQVLHAAQVPLLPKGMQDGQGALVFAADGDPRSVRIIVHAAGHRHQPYPGQRENAAQWRALMTRCIAAMEKAGWLREHSPLHDAAPFQAPHDLDLPELPAPALGCDPEADDFVHQVAGLLRHGGYAPLAAASGEDTAWGFCVTASPLEPDHVMVIHSHNRQAPLHAPYEPRDLPVVQAVLNAYEHTLSTSGLTVANDDPQRTVVWVRRPERSTRARIVLADDCGFAWVPELADTYRLETRLHPDQPWAPQGQQSRNRALRDIETLLRRGLATAEAEGLTLYVTATERTDFAPYSRYVPLNA
ncbi:hypothetical protein [Streptomyces sp. NPDC059003]|uniref:hypothetical protein n=1 Tax=Streptomyces sp. NPDC059003 TaxID=3346691 RepID=UPI003693A1D5